MKRFIDRLMFEFERLGWIGVIGVACLIAALAFDRAMLQPLEAERDALLDRNVRAERARSAQQAAEARTQAALVTATVTAEEAVRRLFAAAESAGLNLKQGDYTLSLGSDASRRHYQISLPVLGEYPQLRAFIARALNENPALALAQVDISRPLIEENQVKANLRFMLFLGESR